MILSDRSILAAMAAGDIRVDPFDRERLGPNSYDVTLGANLLLLTPRFSVWSPAARVDVGTDSAREPDVVPMRIQSNGDWFFPNKLYLGVVNEFVATSPKYVPMIDGTSSAGRLGISIHVTAGRGDAGYAGHFTLEIHVVSPVKVYAGMPIGQIWWLKVDGEVERSYGSRASSNYQQAERQDDPWPKPSAMWKKIKK